MVFLLFAAGSDVCNGRNADAFEFELADQIAFNLNLVTFDGLGIKVTAEITGVGEPILIRTKRFCTGSLNFFGSRQIRHRRANRRSGPIQNPSASSILGKTADRQNQREVRRRFGSLLSENLNGIQLREREFTGACGKSVDLEEVSNDVDVGIVGQRMRVRRAKT